MSKVVGAAPAAPIAQLPEARRMRREAMAESRWLWVSIGAGLLLVGIVLVPSLLVPLFGAGDPNAQDLLSALQPPSIDHLFGTDNLGRDIFARVLYAGRLDLTVGVVTTFLPLAVGVVLGTTAGYFGGPFEAIVMRVVDIVFAFPFVVLVLAIAAIFGPGLLGVVVGISIVGWAPYARLTRGEMLSLRERQFILAAETLGYSRRRIILRHALPNLIRSSLVFSTADMVRNIATLASLSYLGAGVQIPTPEWGAMIAEGQTYLLSAWWLTTLPGLVLVVAGVGFSLIGDGVADRLGAEFRLDR
jgi:peptide/nickel transport system permease protein